jgi:hypothetical protein
MEASTEMSDESAGLSRTLKDCLPVGFIDYDGNIQSDRLIADPDVTAQVRSQWPCGSTHVAWHAT